MHKANDNAMDRDKDSQITPELPQLDELREFRLLAESIPNLAWIARPDGYIYWYNQRWFDYTGTTPAEMVGWGWQSVHDPRVLPQVLERFRSCLDNAEPLDMTFPLLGADGIFRPFLTRVVPVKDETGAVIRWFGTNTEVGDYIRTAAALQESERRFRTATEAVSGILWTNDASGQMKGEQPGWAGFTGQTFDQYQGYGWANAVHPDDAQPSIDEWEASVAERRLFAFEHRVRRHDGIYRLCSIRALPVLNSDGSVHEWVGVHTDITDARHADDALRMSEESLRIAAEVTQLGHCRLEPSTNTLLSCTPIFKANYGRGPDDTFTYADLLASIHPEDLARVRQTLAKAILEDEIYRAEYRVIWPDGSMHWISGNGRLIHFADGTPAQVAGVSHNVTQKHLSEAALLQSEKLAAVGRLASSIAHEINNPLEAITNLIYIARRSTDPDEIHAMLDTADQELRRVSMIANQTLRFHKQSTHPQEIGCADLFSTVISIYEGRLRNSGITVEARKRAIRLIRVYEGDIRQVLNNLIGNAIDAMQGGGRLLIRSRESRRWHTGEEGIVLTIADTGAGMTPETRMRMFDAFFTTKGIAGTGLGLWISTEIMQRHRGSIRVRSSQRPNHHGTVISLFLPFNGPVIPLSGDLTDRLSSGPPQE